MASMTKSGLRPQTKPAKIKTPMKGYTVKGGGKR